MEIDCHNHSDGRYIKVKKENISLSGLAEMCAVSFRSRDDRFCHYLGVNFTFGLLDCDRYISFRSIHFTVTLAGLKSVNHYIRNIVLSKIVISGFHCTTVALKGFEVTIFLSE